MDGINVKCADFNNTPDTGFCSTRQDINLLLFIFRTKFPIRKLNYRKKFHKKKNEKICRFTCIVFPLRTFGNTMFMVGV